MNDQVVNLKNSFNDLTPDEMSEPVKHLVLLLHGILSKSDGWVVTDMAVSGRFHGLEVTVVPISYQLTYPWDLFTKKAEIKSRLVVERINHAIILTPHDVLSVHCHSYGTKIFSWLPEALRTSFDWIFFAGSICHENDDRLFEKHTNRIVNDCGKRDIFPIIAEALNSKIYSQTGVYGFHNPPFFDRFFQYGHSGATSTDHFKEWILPVLTTGKIAVVEAPCPRWVLHAPDILRCASRIFLLSFLVLAGLILT